MEVSCCSFGELAGVAEEWNALLAEAAIPGIFMSWQYQNVWWQHFGSNYDAHILTLREGGVLKGIAPLYIFSGELTDNETDRQPGGSGQRIVRLVGGVDVSDYVDVICQPADAPAVWQAVGQYLEQHAAEWDSLDLHNLPAASVTRALLPDWAKVQGYTVREVEEDKAPYIELPTDRNFETHVAAINKKDRHELRRKTRRFETAFPDYQYSTVPPAAIVGDLADFFRLNRLAAGVKQQFMTEPMAAYFTDLAAALADVGWLRLNYLSVGGKRIASYLAFDRDEVIYLYNTGYDPEYREYSVGLLLAAYFIKDVTEQGYKRFDFMQGTERYKYDLGAVNSEVFNVIVEKNNG